MTSKDTPSPAGPYNFDKLRIDLEEIGQQAKTPTTSSSPRGIDTPITPAIPIISVKMSEETPKLSGKILGGVKLSYENHVAWFHGLDYWAIPRKTRWIYQDDPASILLRTTKSTTEETEIANATTLAVIMSQVNEEDLMMIADMTEAHEVVAELKRKYEDKRPSKTQKEIREFYNYKLGNDETIEQAWSKLRSIARKIISSDSSFKTTVNEKATYAQLLNSLPSEYTTIADVQTNDQVTSIQDKLANLQEKESKLGDKRSSAHWSKERRRPQSNIRSTARTSQRDNLYRRNSSSSSSGSSNKKAKRKQYCELCRTSDHNIKNCSKLDEARRHVSRSRSRSISRSGSKDSKDRSSRQSSKDRAYSRERKDKSSIKDVRSRRFHQGYHADSDSEKDSDDEESKSKGKSKAYVAGSDEISSEENLEEENENAGMAYEVTKSHDSFHRPGSAKSNQFRPSAEILERAPIFNNPTKSMLNKLRQSSTIFPMSLISMAIVERMINVSSPLIFIPKPRHIFIGCLAFLVGIKSHALYQLVKGCIKERASSRSNRVSLKEPTLDLLEDDEVAAFSHQPPLDKWIGDTGATSHMTDKLDLFVDDPTPNESGNRKVIVGGGQLSIRGRGIAMFRSSNTRLHDVLYVPRLGANLISVPKLCGSKNKGVFDQRSMTILDSTNPDRVLLRAERSKHGGLYYVTEIDGDASEIAATADDSNMVDEEAVGVPNLDPSRTYHQDLDVKNSKDEYILWHNRFGHLGVNKLRQLHEVTTLSQAIQVKHSGEITCDTCTIAKSKKNRNHDYENTVTEVLGLISTDVCGQLPRTYEGYQYFLQVIDAYSNHVTVIPTKTRSEAAEQLDQWRKASELATAKKVKVARSDNAPELVKVIKQWEREDGVRADPTAPYTSSQNGKAERAIQNSEQLGRAMLSEAKLPITFWPYAVQTAAYILNRTAVGPMIDGKPTSPEEIWTGKKPQIHHMRVWGCKCYVHIPDNKRLSKLHPRAEEGLFMGYTNTKSQYKVYIKSSKRVSVFDAKCVKFRERIPGGSIIESNSEDPNSGRELQLSSTTTSPAPPSSSSSPSTLPIGKEDSEPVGVVKQSIGTLPIDKTVRTEPAPFVVQIDKTPKDLGLENVRTYSDNSPAPVKAKPSMIVRIDTTPKELGIDKVPVYPIDSLVLNKSQKRSRSASDAGNDIQKYKASRTFVAISAFISMTTIDQAHGVKNRIPHPETYEAAVNDPIHGAAWKEAIELELNALTSNETWEESRRPLDVNVVTSKWVFVVKYAANGAVDRYKARLVARGFTQVYGVDYEETFAPTLRADSLRILLALMALENMEAEQVDVNNAFTESDLNEVIYMHPPKGMKLKNGRVLRLLKSLYGLKQSAREWNHRCNKVLKKMGFQRSEADPCVYYRVADNAIVGVYVDDLLILAPKGKTSIIDEIKDDLRKSFKIKELGEVQRILGMQITRVRSKRTVYIDQTAYIEKFLHEYAMEQDKVKPTAIPMTNESFRKTTIDDEPGDISGYAKRVGSMMFAMVYTRPDIGYALSKLSQFMSNPGKTHDLAVKQALRYLRSTSQLRMKYGPTKTDGHEVAKIYCDSDYAKDLDNRRSVLGHVVMLGGGAVSWSSKRQKSVSTSTTEAEYMALSSAGKQALWMRQFLTDINRISYIGTNKYTFRVYEDNQGAIKLVNNPHIHERSKHIDVAAHFIRELVEFKKIKLRYIRTDRMIADGLTKPLTKDPFERFRSMLGLGEFR